MGSETDEVEVEGIVDDEEYDEDEEGQNEYEEDGFLDDGPLEEEQDEEESQDSDEIRQKKKRRRKREDYVLDEEDYELLEDNTGFHCLKGKKFKRLKKPQHAEVEHYDEEDFDGSGKSGQMAMEKLKNNLFGSPIEDIAEEERAEEKEDEMADFIVDEEIYENHSPVRRRKNPRQGFSSSALQEAREIFGDVDSFLMARKQCLDSCEWRESRLKVEFEAIGKYMTEKDNQIRKIDVPERIQIFEESNGPPPTDEVSIEVESTWIYNQLASGAVPFHGKRDDLSINKEDIMRFLDLHHAQKLDIPSIAMYWKEQCTSLLRDPEEHKIEKKPALKWHKILWTIQDLDKKWLLLQKRKSAIQINYKKYFEAELHREIYNSLKDAESQREVDDVYLKFNLQFPLGEVGVDEGQYKRPKMKSKYSICHKSCLWEVANKFGVSSEQFGMQVSLENMGEGELEDPKETPEEMALNFTCAMFKTPQAVLEGARHMAAVEIVCEPRVRKYVRSTYMKNVVVSTSPTAEGNVTIDSFHQCAGVKWLHEKPLSRFEDAQWLLIQKAEQEKLLQVTIKLPEKIINKLISDFTEYYLSMSVCTSAQLWNEQRKLIIHDALFGFLLNSMEKEARSLLTSRAKSWLRLEYGKALWNKVSVRPYQRKENDISSDDEAAPRAMACCWGPGKPETTFVMLDSSGELLDVLFTGSLTLQSQNVSDRQRKKNDQQLVMKFMIDHQPRVIVLGAVNMSCTRLKADIYEIIFKMMEENPRDVGNEMDGISIVYGDESLPRLFENSQISSDQLPGQPGIVKRAVALGRYLQNPLAMIATLCDPGRELLSWKLCSLENFLTPDEKYGMVEQVMVDVTNQVGLDINLAANHEWLFAPLQFISGLGPRKAASLQRSLVKAGPILNRKDLLMAHGLGIKVYTNAVGFMRVRQSGLAASSSRFTDLLDDTRIHPESYELAKELAKVAYEEDVRGYANDDEDVLEVAIEHFRHRPNRLKTYNVEKYAENNGLLNKKTTIYAIISELIEGFQDWRKKYEEPSQDEEFYMISGETEETLVEGRLVQVTVRIVQAQRAICALESGLTGMIMKEDYSDDWRDIVDLSDRVHQGDILTCKIKSIQKNRFCVFLVSRESETRSTQYQNVRNLDPYYHEDLLTLQIEQKNSWKENEPARKHFKPRMIAHPRFQNVTADEAMKFLSDKDPGESVIRPSSRGPSHLTLTLKLYDGVYTHKDIVEGGKENSLQIGKTLKIEKDTFEDLDEVMDGYVDPLVAHLKAMLSHRKFRRGTKSEVDELLKIEKSENPRRIAYSFGIHHEQPGMFILTYIRNANPHHDYVVLYPKGFKFRGRMFEDINRLLACFQRSMHDPLHDSVKLPVISFAAMVPISSCERNYRKFSVSPNCTVHMTT